MGSLQAVIADRACGRKPNVNEGRPTFELVMSVMVEETGRAKGDARRCRFDRGESGVVVNHIVGQKDFLPASAPHV